MARNPLGSTPSISGSAFAKATELQQRLWFTLGALLDLDPRRSVYSIDLCLLRPCLYEMFLKEQYPYGFPVILNSNVILKH